MYSVILVDDEPIVREGMEYIIDWNSQGFKVIGSAENGVAGLELIKEQKPDIVITDVRMPGLNGLEMVEKAKQFSSKSKYIVLSGYSDFKYAQDALTLGTLQYLLKPIDEIELIKLLNKVKKRIEKENKEEREQKHFQEYLMIQQIFSYIIHEQYSKEIEILKQYKQFQLIEFNENNQYTKTQCEEIEKQVEASNTFIYAHGDSLFLLICDGNDKEIEAILKEKFAEMMIQAIISSKGATVEALPDLYKEIVELNQKKYFFSDEAVLSSRLSRGEQTFLNIDKATFKLKLAIKDNQKKDINQIVDQFVQYFKYSKDSVEFVKREWSALFRGCILFLEEGMNKPVKEIDKDKILSIIWKEKSINQTAEFLKYIFYDFGRFFYESYEKQNIVDEIKMYTSKNYHLNLSLKELAQTFNYSQSYLGKKFKAETSMSYHTYLDNERLEKAKKLLQDDTLYIYEIANMVGYSNYDYFHKKFKKKFLMSPKEYQKKWKEGG